MDIATYLKEHGLSQAKFAEQVATEDLKVTQGLVWQWMNNKTPVSAQAAVRIEQVTGREITRPELRPDDWQKIWPELAAQAA